MFHKHMHQIFHSPTDKHNLEIILLLNIEVLMI